MASSFRPYYPRVQNRPQQVDDVSRGFAAGNMAGKALETLGTAIANARTQANQDQVANQLLNQDYPSTPADPNLDPDADMSTDLPEDVSTDVGGTASPGQQGNFQGGTAELAMRMANAKEQLGMQNLQSEIAQRKAAEALAGQKAAGYRLGGGSSSRWLAGDATGGYGGSSRWGTKPTKPAAYVAGSGDVENDDSTDDFSKIRADFDNQHGKGAFDQFQAQGGGQEVLDKDGNLTGYAVTDKAGKPLATVQVQDAPMWMQRVNAARNKTGQQPIPKMIGKDSVYGQPQNPTSTEKPGTAGNPIVLQNKLQLRSLPYGTVVYDPDTKTTSTKLTPQAAAALAAQKNQPTQ